MPILRSQAWPSHPLHFASYSPSYSCKAFFWAWGLGCERLFCCDRHQSLYFQWQEPLLFSPSAQSTSCPLSPLDHSLSQVPFNSPCPAEARQQSQVSLPGQETEPHRVQHISTCECTLHMVQKIRRLGTSSLRNVDFSWAFLPCLRLCLPMAWNTTYFKPFFWI